MRADDPTGELRTIRDWLRYAVSRFREAGLAFGHGTQDAYDEAAYLILHALELPPDRLEPFLDARLLPSERRTVLNTLRRRIDERIPAAYLTREAWLGPHRFYVDSRVIVPRSYIAEMLDQSLAPRVTEPDRITRVLDLCTGSGCLAILAALAFPNAEVDAVELSAEAIEVARRNVADYGLGERVRVVQSDLFGAVADRRYQVILSNPPYVTSEAMTRLPPEYRREPALALAGGEDGMAVVRRILVAAGSHLTPDGVLLVEIGHNRAFAEAAFPDLPLTWVDTASSEDSVFFLKAADLAGSPRRGSPARRATASRRGR